MRLIIEPTSLDPWSAYKSIPGGGVSAMAPVFKTLLMLVRDVDTSCVFHRILNLIHDDEKNANEQQ